MGDAVQRRTREIGLRVALGAGRSQVAKLVFSEVVHLTAAGLAVGVAGALLIARAVQVLVHGATWPDAAKLVATPALLAFLIGVTAVVPLRRAPASARRSRCEPSNPERQLPSPTALTHMFHMMKA